VNLQPDLSHFALINPCGIGALGVTSAAALLGHAVDLAAFKSTIAANLETKLEELGATSCAA
jgi:lipoate-protein ligase B